MLVDDEAIVRRGIREGIDWSQHGVEIVGEEGNGEAALASILKINPDIVITDIRMPRMDGLKLTENLRELMPHVKIVIISGYEDFTYAKQALKMGVKEYISKPISSEEIIAIVTRLRDEIEFERNNQRRIEDSRSLLARNYFFIKSKFIRRLLKDYRLINHPIIEAEKLHITLSGPYFLVFVLSIDDSGEHFKPSIEENKELQVYAISNIAEDTLPEKYQGTVIADDSFSHLICVVNLQHAPGSFMYTICKEIQENVATFLGISISIGVGNSCRTLSELGESYKQAKETLKYKFYSGMKSIQYYDATKKIKSSNEYTFPVSLIEELLTCVDCDDWDRFHIQLKKMFLEFETELVDEYLVKEICSSLLNSIVRKLGIAEFPWEIYYGRNINPYAEIHSLERMTDIYDWLCHLIHEMYQAGEVMKNREYKSIVHHAIRYMERNYHTNITLDSIAAATHVSPNYFSKLFKTETKTNFIDWLNKLRIEKSLPLLKRSDLKIYEVANRVGYSDYKYYSTLFKKITGITPKQYKDGGSVF